MYAPGSLKLSVGLIISAQHNTYDVQIDQRIMRVPDTSVMMVITIRAIPFTYIRGARRLFFLSIVSSFNIIVQGTTSSYFYRYSLAFVSVSIMSSYFPNIFGLPLPL